MYSRGVKLIWPTDPFFSPSIPDAAAAPAGLKPVLCAAKILEWSEQAPCAVMLHVVAALATLLHKVLAPASPGLELEQVPCMVLVPEQTLL